MATFLRWHANDAAWQDPDGPDDGDDVPKFQVVLELDMETWKVSRADVILILANLAQEAIRVFEIKKSIIPHRNYQQPASLDPNKWYG